MEKTITLEILKENLLVGDRALAIFSKTVEMAQVILKQEIVTEENKIVLEALTARFSRRLDFFLNKLLRTVDIIEITDEGSILDRVNRFKKRGVLDDDTDWRVLKDLRNKIAHEYIIEETDDVVHDSIKYASVLTKAFANLKIYCKKFGV